MRQSRLLPHSHHRPVAPMAIPMMVNALWWIRVADRQHRWTAIACSTSVITAILAAMRWRQPWRRPRILVSLQPSFLIPFLVNSSNCPRITALTALALELPPPHPIESACAFLHHTPSTSTSTHHTALHSQSIQLVLLPLPLPTLTWAHDDAPKNRSPTSTANVVNSASSGAHMLAAQFAGNLWEWEQQEERGEGGEWLWG